MPFLEEIVAQINTTLKDRLASDRFLFLTRGISRAMVREGEEFPAFTDNTGEGTFNAIDDRFSICLYHKCEGVDFLDTTQGFGDQGDLSRESARMAMIVWANRRKVNLTQEQIAAAVVSAMPFSVDRQFQAERGIGGTVIEVQSIDHNQRSLWSREFPGFDFAITPEHAYFQVNYRVETIYDKSCIEFCQIC